MVFDHTLMRSLWDVDYLLTESAHEPVGFSSAPLVDWT